MEGAGASIARVGVGVLKVWIRAEHNILDCCIGDDVAMHAAMLQVEISRLGPNLQNILRQSYDFLTIVPLLRSTYDGRLFYKTSYEGSKAHVYLRYDSLAKL